MSTKPKQFYWQLRQRKTGKVGTAMHAYRCFDPTKQRWPKPWVPLCGEGQHPTHFAVMFDQVRKGVPDPEKYMVCAGCWLAVQAARRGS